MAYTIPPTAQVLTPQQLIELVAGLIIDNNTSQISPYKMRQVLNSIIVSLGANNGVALSGAAPVDFDAFTGIISMLQASGSQDGYLSKEDWTNFAAGTTNTPLSNMEVRVFKKAAGNTGGFTKEVGDWVRGEAYAGVYWEWAIVGSDPTDYSTYDVKVSSE